MSADTWHGREPVEVVAFDLMDTLVHDPYREALAAAFGDRARAAFAGRDQSTWPRFETGELTEAEFWDAHAAWDPDVEAFEQARVDGTVWIDGMVELVETVRSHGRRVVVATNYPSWIDDLEARLLKGVVDDVVASCRVGVRKPDPRFYGAVAMAAAAPRDQILFVDDRPVNVEAAREAGLRAVVFTSPGELRRDLLRAGALPAQ